MRRRKYTADFIMEELSLEELGLITGGVGGFGCMAAVGDDKPDNPWFP